MSTPCLLTSNVSDEELTYKLINDPLYVMSHLFLATFKIFCLLKTLIMAFCGSLCFSYLEFIEFLGLLSQWISLNFLQIFFLFLSSSRIPTVHTFISFRMSHRSLRPCFFISSLFSNSIVANAPYSSLLIPSLCQMCFWTLVHF